MLTQRLLEYPNHEIQMTGQEAVLTSSLEKNKGVLPVIDRYAGRSFCTPGKRLRLAPSSLYPKRLVDDTGKGIGLDEWWGCCTTAIVTGAVDAKTGQRPLREGEAHVLTPDGKLVALQELIESNPRMVIGKRHERFARDLFGKPTWGIVSKKFDNKNPIPWHWHWEKDEVHDVNEFDNPGVHSSHYHTTAMGLYPWVSKEMFLACMKRFGQPGGNGVRELSPHIFIPVGKGGWKMPKRVGHSPTDLCTHEVHVLMDEHFLAESLTLDGEISVEAAFYACREQDYPRDKHGDWEYLVSKVDFAANQNPDFVPENYQPLLRAEQFCSEGVEAKWVIYGLFSGEQKCSILRLALQPGANCKLSFDSPSFFHTNNGCGTVGGLKVSLAKRIELGKVYSQNGFITQQAIEEPGGVYFENTGSEDEDFVITLDFPQNAHLVTPGT